MREVPQMHRVLIVATSLALVGPALAVTPPRLVNSGGWFRNREAPPDALKRGERAMTALDLTIAADGSVAKCAIALPSKSPSLDEYACSLFQAKARFEPLADRKSAELRTTRQFWTWEASKNAADKATSKAAPAQRGANSDVWVTTDDLPRGLLGPEDVVTSNVALTISQTGQISDCAITLPSERPELDRRLCALLAARASYKPARDIEGQPTEGFDWATIRWQVPRD